MAYNAASLSSQQANDWVNINGVGGTGGTPKSSNLVGVAGPNAFSQEAFSPNPVDTFNHLSDQFQYVFNTPSTNPFSDKYGQQGYNPYNFTQYDYTNQAPSDPYAGTTYTGTDTYTPPETDPSEYWNKATSGYDQMPEYGTGGNTPYTPYDVAGQYDEVQVNMDDTDWENANTYAPWSGYSPGGNSSTPYELSQQPGFTVDGGRNAVGHNAMNWMLGAGGENPLLNSIGLGWLGAKKKKRPTFNFEAPSYQGHMFTPEEGFPEYYNPSAETTANATQQDLYSAGTTTIETPSYDYSYTGGSATNGDTAQDYVGQQNEAYGSLYNQDDSLYSTFTV